MTGRQKNLRFDWRSWICRSEADLGELRFRLRLGFGKSRDFKILSLRLKINMYSILFLRHLLLPLLHTFIHSHGVQRLIHNILSLIFPFFSFHLMFHVAYKHIMIVIVVPNL